MIFYEGHTLVDTNNDRSFFNKKRLIFSDEFRQKCIKKSMRNKEFFEKAQLEIKVRPYADEQKAHLCLYGVTPNNTLQLAQVTLSTVEYNCSALGVANLDVDYFYGSGLGWYLMDLVEQWALFAGYTLLIGNTAGLDQNRLIPVFEKQGWLQSNIKYVNARTRNENIWLFKVIQEVEPTVEDEEDEDYYEDNDDLDHDEDI